MKIAIFGKQFNKEFIDYFEKIVALFLEKEVDLFVYAPFHKYLRDTFSFREEKLIDFHGNADLPDDTQLLLSIGGDGTFLDAATIVRDKGIPMVGINSGRLGFLAATAKNDIEMAVAQMLAGEYEISERSLIEVISPSKELKINYALNEVAISKNETTSMVTVHTYLDDEFLTTYWADGLLVSTPTGSTAYSLSVGGPIIAPGCQNFVISPISPHNLTMRPIVIPDRVLIKLEVACRSSNFLISLDSRFKKLKSGTEILMKKADFTIKVVNFADSTFLKTLRDKLMWGMDKRN